MVKTILILILPFLQLKEMRCEYPEWFIFPGSYPEIITGFSYKSSTSLADAKMMYCVYKLCEVEGYVETIVLYVNKYYKNSEYFYIYPTTCVECINGLLHHKAGFCVDVLTEQYVSAFSTDTGYVLESKILNIQSLKKPDWVNKNVWEEDGYYYGVGMYTCMGNDNDAWKTSEESAIFNIITYVSMDIFSLSRLTYDIKGNNELINYLRIDVDFTLIDIEILERWPDIDNEYFYTLVRIKKDNVLSNK